MKQLIVCLLLIIPSVAFCQFGVSFHQTNLPFAGFNYEITNKLRPEIRIGTDQYFDALSVEGVLTYDMIDKEDFEVYGGLGIRLNGFAGLVIPVGINIYPLANKQFGFHIEMAPIVGEEQLLRGSWGIRYRFQKRDTK